MNFFITLLLNYFIDFGYGGIIFLMAVESSFIPFPSEVVIPPAAYLASQGQMNIFLVALSGIVGGLIGATINYLLAYWLGRVIVYKLTETKLSKIFLINKHKVKKAEKYFLKYGNISTFIGRLLPGIRQLISIPAGFSGMNFFSFIFFTFLGSSIWVVILSVLGYFFGANKKIFQLYYKEATIFLISVSLLVLVYFLIKKMKSSTSLSRDQ